MRPALTGQQADALASLLVSLRPGQRRWTKTAVYDALVEAGTKFTPDAETLIRAAVRAAITGSIVSPEVIAMRGAHWESVEDTPTTEGPRAATCERCHDRHMRDAPCSGPPADHSTVVQTIAQLRQSVSDAKARRKAAEKARADAKRPPDRRKETTP